jgi:hypothetical protein
VTLLDTGEHTGGEVTELFGVARATVYRANNAPDATTQHLPSDRRAAAQDCRYPPKGEASPSRFGAVRLLLIRESGSQPVAVEPLRTGSRALLSGMS